MKDSRSRRCIVNADVTNNRSIQGDPIGVQTLASLKQEKQNIKRGKKKKKERKWITTNAWKSCRAIRNGKTFYGGVSATRRKSKPGAKTTPAGLFSLFCSLDSHLIKQYAKCKSHESHANSLQSGPGLEGRDTKLRGEDGTTHSFLHRTVPFFFFFCGIVCGIPKITIMPHFLFSYFALFSRCTALELFRQSRFCHVLNCSKQFGYFWKPFACPPFIFFFYYLFLNPVNNSRSATFD